MDAGGGLSSAGMAVSCSACGHGESNRKESGSAAALRSIVCQGGGLGRYNLWVGKILGATLALGDRANPRLRSPPPAPPQKLFLVA